MAIRPLRRIQTNWIPDLPGAPVKHRVLASDLCEELGEYLDQQAVADVYRAYDYGARAHDGQTRRSGEEYITHPVSVAQILAEMRLDSRSIMAAILHDVVEDTAITTEVLAEEFGEDVAQLVDGVTKINQIEFDSREEAEAENFRKMLLAMSRDIRVILIKLGDRLHNMRTLDALAPEKRVRIASQTLDIFAPIANRLGMHRWSRELEDLSFRHIYPKRYDAITKALKRRKGNRRSVLKKLNAQIVKHLSDVGIVARVEGREKNAWGIYRKMQRKHVAFEQVLDIQAFRIIVDDVDACYRVLGRMHQLYKPIPGRFKDYIAIPKSNGYQSLHTTVFGTFGESLEVQIRTEEMHRIAEAGVASHWMYKSDEKTDVAPQDLARQWLLDLLDTQSNAGDPSEFLEHLKIDLFPDQVYVFTPDGEIKKLPLGATALDFAFAVHSDLGNRCVGARINQKHVPLHEVLKNGDHVEILTTRSARPSPSWLNYAITSKARAAIRASLKNRRNREAITLGRQLLDRALKGVGHRRRLSSEQKVGLLETLKLEHWDELLADIGFGKRPAMIVARQIYPSDDEQGDEVDEFAVQSLAIRGAERLLITYGKCCHPIPGDPIIGFFSKGRGLVVHTTDCPNNSRYRKHPENSVHVHWAENLTGVFQVLLRLEIQNQPGVLAKAASIIAENDSNIVNVHLVERDGRNSQLNFSIEVRDRIHLAQIMRQLHNEDEIFRLYRVKG